MNKHRKSTLIILCTLLLIISFTVTHDYISQKFSSNVPLQSIKLKSTVDIFLTPDDSRKNEYLKLNDKYVSEIQNYGYLETISKQIDLKVPPRETFCNQFLALFFNFYQISRTCVESDLLADRFNLFLNNYA